jgi:hypothetical protein
VSKALPDAVAEVPRGEGCAQALEVLAMPACRRVLTRVRAAHCFVLAILLGLSAVPAVRAATPSGGTLSLANPTLNWTGTPSGAGSGENTCVDGVSCDSFRVELAPGDYTTKQVRIQVSWTVPAFDYDLYVHDGTLSGPVHKAQNGGPPGTEEHVLLTISPGVVTTPIVWWAHIQAASVPVGQTYNGSATLLSLPNALSVSYVPGNLTFSHTVPLFATATVRDEEPSVHVDVQGNCYVGGIRGVPAGVDMWRFDLNRNSPTFDPEMRHGTYLGQPDVFQAQALGDSSAGGADGGGDIEFAMSHPATPNLTPTLTMVSLALANISSSVSSDEGVTWTHDPAAATISADDRQWIDTYGPSTVYLFYRAPIPSNVLNVQKSTDHGMTYGPAVPVLDSSNPATTTPGYISVDQNDGTVYVSHLNSSELYVAHSTDGGATWTNVLVDNKTGHGHLFDPVRVGLDGTVYTCWSNDRHVLYSYSTDHGNTWTSPAIVDDPDQGTTNVFPWIDAGSAGRIDVVWFGTSSQNNSAAEWDVHFAQCLNANTSSPVFREQVISDHRVHGSNISEGGLTGAANRNLGDYFQVAYDPQGAAVVSFADDHNDFDGNVYVTRQLDGTSLVASNDGDGTVAAVRKTDLPLPDMSQPEVTDPAHDAIAQVQPIPSDNPFDILSIKYFAEDGGPQGPMLGATMKLSGLTAAPPSGTWRIGFTANAPWVTSQMPDGVSDHGDMFYLLAADSASLQTFSYGTAYRDSNPLAPVVYTAYAMAYNPPSGAADFGTFDTTTSTVTVKVALSKLNALLPAGHAPIADGSWLVGLRGSASGSDRGPRDNTRGGLYNFRVRFSGPAGVDPQARAGVMSVSAWPNPCREEAALRYSVPARSQVSLAIYDLQGQRVRTLVSGVADAGQYLARWDGRAQGGEAASPGVYFARLDSGHRHVVSKLVMLK